MPGDDFIAVARRVTEVLGAEDIVFVPELPVRGPHAGMIGRTAGLLEIPIDLQASGWRVTGGSGRDQRRAGSLLRQDLDELEEVLADLDVVLKQQLVGPLTLAAALDRPRGDRMLADHGARRDLAAALAVSVAEHLAELARRFGPRLIVQLDEPSAPAVLGGQIATASGWSRHRSVSGSEARELWRLVTDAAHAAGAEVVLHCCATDPPVALAASAGFDGVSTDLDVGQPDDDWAEAIEDGLQPWWGANDARQVESFARRLSLGLETFADKLVISAGCGLADRSLDEATRTLAGAVAARESLSR